ncbi:replication protein A 70 kDa DNA-binding subunit B-like [Senna tora]|uniref:Replication protein A 70 kDa DNA-binding subunit B-like n=1 Tax=Senna tora TaxID=362788 RepID=A0A834TTX4_9FABA|nr:replication protein A 70 kDa DNA-binding subunit B-like [Senna tora]
MANYKEGPIVIALQHCKINEFNGQRSLANSMHATRILIIEDLEGFMGFDDNQSALDLKSSLNGNYTSSVLSASLNDDSFTSMMLTSISELLIAADDRDLDGAIFYCTKCETSVSTPMASFRVELVVIDDTSPANITLFDCDASKFLGITTNYLKRKATQATDDQMQPIEEFDKFLSILFVFKVATPSFTM